MQKTGSLLARLGLIAILAPVQASASEAVPGVVTASSESECFAARAVLTDEVDWKAKWDSAEDATPSFNTRAELDIGDQATLLLLFSCPSLVEEKARIECDIKLTGTDGAVLLQQGGIACYENTLSRPLEGEHLAELWLDFNVTEDDGTGIMEVDLGMTDRNLGERLTMSFPITFSGKRAQ